MNSHIVCIFLALWVTSVAADESGTPVENPLDNPIADDELAEVTVRASRVAITSPAGSYASLATTLRFDPQTELQSRGLAEGQSDVTVHGGIFENTGFVLGAATIMDPQTGHYTAGLPVDPDLLSPLLLNIGIDNAVGGFNSNIATVAYSLPVLGEGGDVLFGIGDNDLWYSSLRLAKVRNLHGGGDLGFAMSAAWSEGDGTQPSGDHDFARYNLLVQHRHGNSQTDILIAYQDKFYAWPGAYTGFAFLPETDHTKTRLVHVNHRREYTRGWFELSAYYRELDDDYDFDRTTEESGVPGSFEHETRIFAAGMQGSFRSGRVDWRYGGQVTSDKLVRSTDLTYGYFNSRNYIKLSLVPTIDFAQSGNRTLTARFGATVDSSNRDSTEISPLASLTLLTASSGSDRRYTIEYASASQVPGYTALNSRPAGLFGGNPDLGREVARQLSVSVSQQALNWKGSVAVFYRRDNDLVDWTYSTQAPFSRQANPVDLDVLGVELLVSRQWNDLHINAGYTFLDKDEDYGDILVDASFYALNFARHRATLALRYQFSAGLELRLDNEYRVQRDNPLRSSDGDAWLAAVALAWMPQNIAGLGFTLTVDNVTDSDFQFFPGTPAVGRQFSLSAAYSW